MSLMIRAYAGSAAGNALAHTYLRRIDNVGLRPGDKFRATASDLA